ncbi:MAG: hypothetical protein RIC36_19665 [Rhodospirillales bacterium]
MTADEPGQFSDVVTKHFGPDSRLAIRGSAVTGLKFNGQTDQYGVPVKDKSGNPTGRMQQFGKNSDFDFAIVDKDLLRDIKMHPGLRRFVSGKPEYSLGIYYNDLKNMKLETGSLLWKLRETLANVQDLTKRKHSIMVYRSNRDIEDRGPHM